MPRRQIYTVLYHKYEASSYHSSNVWSENDIDVISSHISLREANLVVILEMHLDEDSLDRDLTGECTSIDEMGDMGYIRHVEGRLDAMRSEDDSNGERYWVVVNSLNEDVRGYGDDEDEDEGDYEGEDHGEGEDEATTSLESTRKRSPPSQDDEIQYMGTKKARSS